MKNFEDMSGEERRELFERCAKQFIPSRKKELKTRRWLRLQRKVYSPMARLFGLICPECKAGIIYSLNSDDTFKCKKCGCEFKTHSENNPWIKIKEK